MDKKVVVISGVNLIDAGPLSVFNDFLNTIVMERYSEKYRIIALVGKKELFSKYVDSIEIIEFPKSKKSWFNRLYLEYIGFNKFSKKNNVFIWISMHDITPNVNALHKYVYCHNPSPFNDMSIKDAKFGVKYYLFSKFYRYLYKINIQKNDAVIVQQDWMRKEFIKMYSLKNVIVARPSFPTLSFISDKSEKEENCIFVCPSFPRYYKNFQLACEAAEKLRNEGINNFRLFLTLSGDENKYSQFLREKYGHNLNIIFDGLQSRKNLFDLYARSRCLIFVSKIETWGMPITEYKITNKPMIVADVPYAHETVGEYENVDFVSIDDSEGLKEAMMKVISGSKLESSHEYEIGAPFAKSWSDLCKMIL